MSWELQFDQATLDIAHEWTTEHHPELDGEAFDLKWHESCLAIRAAEKDCLHRQCATHHAPDQYFPG